MSFLNCTGNGNNGGRNPFRMGLQYSFEKKTHPILKRSTCFAISSFLGNVSKCHGYWVCQILQFNFIFQKKDYQMPKTCTKSKMDFVELVIRLLKRKYGCRNMCQVLGRILRTQSLSLLLVKKIISDLAMIRE